MTPLSLILGVWKNKVPESILAAEFDTRAWNVLFCSLDYLDTEQTI